MNRIRVSIATFGLAALSISCASDGPSTAAQSSGGSSPGDGGHAGGTTQSSSGDGGGGGSGGLAGGGAPQGAGGSVGNTGGIQQSSGGSFTGGSSSGGSGAGGDASDGIGGMSNAGGASPEPRSQPQLVTSGDSDYWVEGEYTEVTDSVATITVDENTVYQKWLGFGGTFNEAGWDALMQLTPADQALALQLLFDINEGAGFDWGRIPIGASDYAMDRYSLDEISAGTTDYEMESFSIERDRQMLIPFVKAALGVKSDLRLWASPWSPPAWMKDSGQLDGTDKDVSGNGATFTSHMLSDEATLNAFALYLARFVEEYASEGIDIEHVQPQNEPGYEARYPSCLWDPGLLGKFVGEHLGPTLSERGLKTEIWLGTLSNDTTYGGHMNGISSTARDYLVGVGLQWNTKDHVQELAGQDYLVMQTEHKCGNYPFTVQGAPAFNADQPPNDHAYGEESWALIKEWLDAGVHIYSAWNMVLDTKGHNLDPIRPWPQNALLIVDRDTKTLRATAAYYVFRHLSQFVDTQADRIETSDGNSIAFKNPDNSIITVLYNPENMDRQTVLGVGGATVQFTVPAHGWATVNFE